MKGEKSAGVRRFWYHPEIRPWTVSLGLQAELQKDSFCFRKFMNHRGGRGTVRRLWREASQDLPRVDPR